MSMPIARAFRSRGWIQVDSKRDAHIIYTYSNNADWARTLKKWQRFNYIPGYKKWNNKYTFVYYYNRYYQQLGRSEGSVYVPETYMLTDETEYDIQQFQSVLEKQGGRNFPWVKKEANVNQGRGITIMAPNSQPLLELPRQSLEYVRRRKQKKDGSESKDDADDSGEIIIQKYICNEMTWYVNNIAVVCVFLLVPLTLFLLLSPILTI
jgi:hypothetical protein